MECGLVWKTDSTGIYYRKLLVDAVKGESYFYDISNHSITKSSFPSKTFGEMRINNLSKAVSGDYFVDILNRAEGDYDDFVYVANIVVVTDIKKNEIVFEIPSSASLDSYNFEYLSPSLILLHKDNTLSLLSLSDGKYYDLLNLPNEILYETFDSVGTSPDRTKLAAISKKYGKGNSYTSSLNIYDLNTGRMEVVTKDVLGYASFYWLSNNKILLQAHPETSPGNYISRIVNTDRGESEDDTHFPERGIITVF